MKKVLLIAIACTVVVLISTLLAMLFLKRKDARFTPWNPLPKERRAEVPDPTVSKPDVGQPEKNGGPILGLIDRQFIYFQAGHLSSGDGELLEPDSVDIWTGSGTKRGDTVTVSMPWGHATLAVVDTIQYRYEEYYHYHDYYFIAHRIDTLDAGYYDRMTNACVIIKGKRLPTSEYDLLKCGLYNRDESNIIDRWVDEQLPAVRDTFNEEARRSVIKDTISESEKVRGSKRKYKLLVNGESKGLFFVTAEWSTDEPVKPMGIYSMGLIKAGAYKPYWVERWIKPDGDIGFIADIVGLVVTDTAGRLGVLLNRAFYEGRDVQLRILSKDLKRFEVENDILDH